MRTTYLLTSLSICAFACSLAACKDADQSPPPLPGGEESERQASLDSPSANQVRPSFKVGDIGQQKLDLKKQMVSRHDLDDRKFLITRFVVGYKDYLGSKSPYLNFDKPVNSDYVEVMRCKRDAVVGTGLDGYEFSDVEIASGLSPLEKSRIFRNNDFWALMSASPHCQVISLGNIAQEFLDSWAPSGAFRYALRPCVAKARLIDPEGMQSNRMCSRQIAISAPLADYQNQRTERQKEALKEAELVKSELNQQGVLWYHTIREYGARLEECEEREHQRAVSAKKKAAITNMVATVVGVTYEFSSVYRTVDPGRSLNQHLWIQYGLGRGAFSGGALMDKVQLSGELGGFSFELMFRELAKTSDEIPRTCTAAIALDNKAATHTERLTALFIKYDYFQRKALYAHNEQQGVSGMGGGQGGMSPGP